MGPVGTSCVPEWTEVCSDPVCVCVCVQEDQGGVTLWSPDELAPAVCHRQVRRRPAAGAAGLSGPPTAAGTCSDPCRPLVAVPSLGSDPACVCSAVHLAAGAGSSVDQTLQDPGDVLGQRDDRAGPQRRVAAPGAAACSGTRF